MLRRCSLGRCSSFSFPRADLLNDPSTVEFDLTVARVLVPHYEEVRFSTGEALGDGRREKPML